jgi:hypothetical protein
MSKRVEVTVPGEPKMKKFEGKTKALLFPEYFPSRVCSHKIKFLRSKKEFYSNLDHSSALACILTQDVPYLRLGEEDEGLLRLLQERQAHCSQERPRYCVRSKEGRGRRDLPSCGTCSCPAPTQPYPHIIARSLAMLQTLSAAVLGAGNARPTPDDALDYTVNYICIFAFCPASCILFCIVLPSGFL